MDNNTDMSNGTTNFELEIQTYMDATKKFLKYIIHKFSTGNSNDVSLKILIKYTLYTLELLDNQLFICGHKNEAPSELL